jgi:hypothetical protein
MSYCCSLRGIFLEKPDLRDKSGYICTFDPRVRIKALMDGAEGYLYIYRSSFNQALFSELSYSNEACNKNIIAGQKGSTKETRRTSVSGYSSYSNQACNKIASLGKGEAQGKHKGNTSDKCEGKSHSAQ